MARPIAWVHRIHQIRKSVKNSVRSHYTRRDLELLFELQPSAAGKLMGLFPRAPVGSNHLVTREDLAKFLDEANEADDVEAFCRSLRQDRQPTSRRKLRTLRRSEFDVPTVASLPRSITLGKGSMTISFVTLDQLLESLGAVALCLQQGGDTALEELSKICEPDRPTDEALQAELADGQFIDNEIQRLIARMRTRVETATVAT